MTASASTRTFVGLRSVRPRVNPPRVVVLHWTGGTGGLGRLFDVLRATTGPRTPDGLSVHFGVDPDGVAERWAPDELVTLHAGFINPDALGVEICSPGYSVGSAWAAEKKRGVVRREYEDRIRGHRVRMVDFTQAQLDAVGSICDDWTTRHGIPRDFPREPDGTLLRREMTPVEAGRFRGVMGHYHCHATKNDPGTGIFLYLAKRWGVALI